MFQSDYPIEKPEDDLLGRRLFADRLAQAILGWHEKSSLVIALFGSWGSGKTSLLNMAIAAIEQSSSAIEADANEPLVLKFNPWRFASEEQILAAFFGDLSALLDSKIDKAVSKIGEKVRKYGALLTSQMVRAAYRFIPIVGASLAEAAEALHESVDVLQSAFPNGNTSLEELRQDVRELFASLERKVVIVIDDIDRLRDEEIRFVLQLVKLNADFPNTVYVLAADREVLEGAVSESQRGSGRGYLEKIIQVGIDVPKIDEYYLRKLVLDGINDVLSTRDFAVEGSNDEFWALYNAGFQRLFTSLRAVKRFLNSFAFVSDLLAKDTNSVDLIGLEAIRVFAPETYQEIAYNKGLFTLLDQPFWVRAGANLPKERLQELKTRVDAILARSAVSIHQPIKEICLYLFPVLECLYSTGVGLIHGNQDSRARRRLCSREVFDHYFILAPPVGEVSAAEIDLLMQELKDMRSENAARLLEKYRSDKRLSSALAIIGDRTNHWDESTLCALIMLLSSIYQVVEFSTDEGALIPKRSEVRIAASRAFARVEQPKRIDLLTQLLSHPQNAPFVIDLVASMSRWNDVKFKPSEDDEHDTRVWKTIESKCQQVCVDRLVGFAQSGELTIDQYLPFILLKWKEWDSGETSYLPSFIESCLSQPQTALSLLTEFISRPDDLRDTVRHPKTTQPRLNELFSVAPRDRVAIALEGIPEADIGSLPALERETLQAWRAWLIQATETHKGE